VSARAGQPVPGTGPELPGLELVRTLGRGGSAEVFLYNELTPRRPVAVKVLFADRLTALARHQFSLEADAMAALGNHPYVVQVFRSGVTADDRPYLVMCYYPNPNLAERARTERLAVAEVLQIGVRIACAVETAHRAGIIHRDIKPHNILTGEYGEPGLTDFGIAANVAAVGEEQAEGLSIPWAAPEVVYGTSSGDRAADVYSLGATLWTALVGRSPFEVPGGENSYMAMMRRIHDERPPRTGRQDVPAALELLLAQTMAKSPADRPPSALQLARSLQAIEAELGLAQTPLALRADRSGVETEPVDGSGRAGSDLVNAEGGGGPAVGSATPVSGGRPPGPSPLPVPAGTADELKTRLRPVRAAFADGATRASRDALAQPPPVAPESHRSAHAARAPGELSRPGLDGDETIHRPRTASSVASAGRTGAGADSEGAAGNAVGADVERVPGQAAETPSGRMRRALAVVAGVSAVIVLALAVALLGGHGHPRTQGTATSVTSPPPTLALAPAPPVVTVVTLSGGRARFSWSEPNRRTGEDFAWRLVGQSTWHPASTDSVVLSVAMKHKTCIQVEVGVDDNVEVTQSKPACTP